MVWIIPSFKYWWLKKIEYINTYGLILKIKAHKVLDFLKRKIPPPREIKIGSQAAKIGGNKPFTPNELNTNDIT